MAEIVNGLSTYFGLDGSPVTVLETIIWFVKMSFGCALFRYVLYSMFWMVSQFRKGAEK